MEQTMVRSSAAITYGVSIFLCFWTCGASPHAGASTPGGGTRLSESARPLQVSGLAFTENAGQIVDASGRTRPDIRYVADAGGVRLAFTQRGMSAVFHRAEGSGLAPERKRGAVEEDPAVRCYRMDVLFEGCNPNARMRVEDAAAGVLHFYYAHCPDGILNVRQYRTLVYENLWSGIDAVFAERDGRFKYEFRVRPGGNPSDIRLRYEGADALRVEADGGLAAIVPLGAARELAPETFQRGVRGEREMVPSAFRVEGATVSFALGSYDLSRELVIDPWATYYGGSGNDKAADAVFDGNGNVIIAGWSDGTTFPVQNAQQSTKAGGLDAVVVKFNASGVRQWATYYGGSLGDNATAVAVDGNGNVAITGRTISTDFPVQNAQQATLGGNYDGFIVKFNASGVRQWATYHGGNTTEEAYGVGFSASGDVAVTGRSYSTNFPVLNAYQSTPTGVPDVTIAKYGDNGVLKWSTYYGGSDPDFGWDLAVDGPGNIYVTGQTQSSDFPVSGAQQSASGGGGDGFLIKFSEGGSRLWATYIGGSDFDEGDAVDVNASGAIAVAGITRSGNFPLQNAQQNARSGSSDPFITMYNASGTRQWATYYGGPGSNDEDGSSGVAIDGSGNVTMAGWSTGAGFPVANAQQSAYAGGSSDVILAQFNSSGVRQWATYYGGSSDEWSGKIAANGSGAIAVSGYTASTDLFVPSAFQGANAGAYDAFVSVFTVGGNLPVELESFTARFTGAATLLRFRTASETNNAGFDIERRLGADAATWESIAFVPGQGGTAADYEYTDRLAGLAALPASISYRLRQVDQDGSSRYSPVLSVRTGNAAARVFTLEVYPTPASDETTVTIRAAASGRIDVTLHDALGREVRASSHEALSGETASFQLLLRDLPSGSYHLRVRNGAFSATQRVNIVHR
jgi:hypothetical protein